MSDKVSSQEQNSVQEKLQNEEPVQTTEAKEVKPQLENKEPVYHEVFFGELNFDATEEDIRVHFKDCGDIA